MPARLKTELEQIKLCLSGKADFDSYPELEKHKDWYEILEDMFLYKCGYIHGNGSHKEIRICIRECRHI